MRIKDLIYSGKVRVCVNIYNKYGTLENFYIPYYKAVPLSEIDSVIANLLIVKIVDHKSHLWIEVIKMNEEEGLWI